MTSIFEVSSHLNTTPSRLAGSIHLAHWHPVERGSEGGTIISTLSFLWTTPITLTVLPSLMYLQLTRQSNYSQSANRIFINKVMQLFFQFFLLYAKSLLMLAHAVYSKNTSKSLTNKRALILSSLLYLNISWQKACTSPTKKEKQQTLLT